MTPKKPTREAGARAGDAQVSPKRVKKPQGGPERVQRGERGVKKRQGEGEKRRQGDKPKPKVKPKAKVVPVKRGKETAWEASQALPDGQQERFCQLMADGRYSQRSCYAQAYGCDNDGSARTLAWRLLTKVDITDRIDWLKAESVKNWKCEKEEVMRFLHQVIVTPVGYVDEESPLAQEVQREEMQMGGARGQLKRGQAESGNEEESPPVEVIKVKIKTPGKVEAAKLLAQMQGWEKPKEMNLTVNYEPPNAALERMKGKGIDVVEMLKKAGVMKHD